LTFSFARRGSQLRPYSKHGDLFLISVAIVAAALCDLPLKSLSGTVSLARTACFVAGVVLILFCTLAFVDVASLIQDKQKYDHSLVAYGSLVMFFFSFLTAGSCVAIAEAVAISEGADVAGR
jgi:hypothetical protein